MKSFLNAWILIDLPSLAFLDTYFLNYSYDHIGTIFCSFVCLLFLMSPMEVLSSGLYLSSTGPGRVGALINTWFLALLLCSASSCLPMKFVPLVENGGNASSFRPGLKPSEFRGSLLSLMLFTSNTSWYYKKRTLMASDLHNLWVIGWTRCHKCPLWAWHMVLVIYPVQMFLFITWFLWICNVPIRRDAYLPHTPENNESAGRRQEGEGRAVRERTLRKCREVKSLSHVRFFAIPWTVVYQASLSMGFSRQEYWSGLPFPSPGDLPDPGIEPRSPALQADALPSEPPGKLG